MGLRTLQTITELESQTWSTPTQSWVHGQCINDRELGGEEETCSPTTSPEDALNTPIRRFLPGEVTFAADRNQASPGFYDVRFADELADLLLIPLKNERKGLKRRATNPSTPMAALPSLISQATAPMCSAPDASRTAAPEASSTRSAFPAQEALGRAVWRQVNGCLSGGSPISSAWSFARQGGSRRRVTGPEELSPLLRGEDPRRRAAARAGLAQLEVRPA